MEHFYTAVNDALRVQKRAEKRAFERARRRRQGSVCAVVAVLVFCLFAGSFSINKLVAGFTGPATVPVGNMVFQPVGRVFDTL